MAVMPPVGTEFAGYRLVWVVSKGDRGTLFLAEDPYLGAVIALKVLDPWLADDDVSRTRFLEESAIAASMNHPNVISIHDIGSSDGLLYIAMRCVTGTDLRQLLRENGGRMAADQSSFLIGQAARALDAAHRHGLVHRGIKPTNLLIQPGADGSGPDHLYVTDFGITGEPADGTRWTGTRDYLAPEQLRGLPTGGAADQYSLGCVLYECLTGSLPSRSEPGTALAGEEPVPPTALCPDLPTAIDAVFARVLAADPGDRFENCREFVAAARLALRPMTDPRSAAMGSPLLRPVSYPAPPYGPVLTSAPLPAPVPAGYPAEVAHEAIGAPGADGLVPGPPDSPLTPSPGLPDPVLSPVPRRERRRGWLPDPGRWSWPGRERGRVWLLALAALVLVAGTTAGVALSLTGGNGDAAATGSAGTATRQATSTARPTVSAKASVTTRPSTGASRPVSASPEMSMAASATSCTKEQPGSGTNGPTTLAAVLADANSCSVPGDLIPAAKCAPGTSTTPGEQIITCTAPAPYIVQVTFRTYPTLAALYGAYTSSVSSLNGTRAITQNTRASCGATGASYAEAGWNHQEVHPRQYTVAEMAAGEVPQLSAMGRLACFSQGKSQYLV
ncbi:MAG: serine/threonine protein kinase, partial [Trebonia sp.]